MSDHSKDFFIKDSIITAYSINAFTQAVAQAVASGVPLDYDSARRIGSSFSVSVYDKSPQEIVENIQAQEQPKVETKEASASEAEVIEEQSTDESGQAEEPSEESTDVVWDNSDVLTLEKIEAAKDSMKDLLELGEPLDIRKVSKKDMVAALKEHLEQNS